MNEEILKRIGQLCTLILRTRNKDDKKALNYELENAFLEYFIRLDIQKKQEEEENAKAKKVKICKAEGCNNKHFCKGYCVKHYRQIQNHGRLTPELEQSITGKCTVPGCEAKHYSKGYCLRHFRQIKKYGRLTPETDNYGGKQGCKVEGCAGKHHAKGYCMRHYYQVKKHGKVIIP